MKESFFNKIDLQKLNYNLNYIWNVCLQLITGKYFKIHQNEVTDYVGINFEYIIEDIEKNDIKHLFESTNFLFNQTTAQDGEVLLSWINQNPENYRYLLGEIVPEHTDLEKLKNGLKDTYSHAFTNPKIQSLTVKTKEVNETIGYVDFTNEKGEVKISMFLKPEKQNKGFGKEILNNLLAYIFCSAHLFDVKIAYLSAYPQNIAAIKCYIKSGFLPWFYDVDLSDGNQAIWDFLIDSYISNGVSPSLFITRQRWEQIVNQEIDIKDESNAQIHIFMQALRQSGLTVPIQNANT